MAMRPTDFQDPYLRQVFGFFGIDDVEFVRAEGMAYSPQHRADALAAAHASIKAPCAPQPDFAFRPLPCAGTQRVRLAGPFFWRLDQAMRSAPPMYGRSTSGTSMLPSAFW